MMQHPSTDLVFYPSLNALQGPALISSILFLTIMISLAPNFSLTITSSRHEQLKRRRVQ